MVMKVYLVMSYVPGDPGATHSEGVFNDRKLAEDYCKKLEAENYILFCTISEFVLNEMS